MVKTIAVTGGIGSGKSLVCSMLAGKGFPVYDSDSAVKRLYDEDAGLLRDVAAVMSPFPGGERVIGADGRLDRKALAEVVFDDGKALEVLESVVHPAVLRDFRRWRDGSKALCGYVVMESAIILEKPLFREVVDAVIVVDAPLPMRIARAAARDGVPLGTVEARVARQKLMNAISLGYTFPEGGALPGGYTFPEGVVILLNDGTEQELSARLDGVLESIIGNKIPPEGVGEQG